MNTCHILSVPKDVLTYILSYTCPESYQSVSLVCQAFNVSSKTPAFWAMANEKGLRVRLNKLGITQVPIYVFQDFNPFFRPRRLESLPRHLKWFSFLKWHFQPDNDPRNDMYVEKKVEKKDDSDIVRVVLSDKLSLFGIFFEWQRAFSRCYIKTGCFSVVLGGLRLFSGAFQTVTYLRHPRMFYEEHIAYRNTQVVLYMESRTNKDGLMCIWRGRGNTHNTGLSQPDESDPNGQYSRVDVPTLPDHLRNDPWSDNVGSN